ncbi:MAG TPA: glycoside hydrolase family 2, partial [Hyphomicrobiaceae bacterium]|nr:glycoside hydrolase family 2 [Hyphomicrobiaceae bacterium]
ENWGVDLVHDPSHRDWLRRRYEWLKHYDPMRLVVDNSPLHPSFHVETDIVDYHFYAAIPDNRHAWDRFVDMLADRKPFLFSPEDAVTTGKEPLMCSEFGNWGLPNPRELADADGREPWWFETGHDWGGGVMYPHGMENRFADWHLDRVFGTLDDFVVAAQWQQFRALKYQIEKLRARPEIAGYVITELTDVHWESNGLLDMRRNKRVFHEVFHTINSETMIVPEIERTSFWAGEKARIRLKLAHGGGRTLERSALMYDLSGCEAASGSIETPPLHAGTVVDLGDIEIALPDVAAAVSVRLDFRLGDSSAPASRAWVDLSLHPRQRDVQRVPVYSPDAAVREHLVGLGYDVVGEANAALLIVSTTLDDAIAAHVRQGGRLLLLPETEIPLYPLFPHWQNVQVEARAGTPWQGDWASSFSWLHRAGPFTALPGGPLLDMAFDRVLPTHVISGANLHDFHGRVHAGLVVGWIHKPVALAIERGYGKGHFVASTFRLFRDPPGVDPTATLLLEALAERAVLGRELPMEPQDTEALDVDFTQGRAAG